MVIYGFKKGFSLPEVLITLTIIGIVAVLILPSLIKGFEERINSYREANVANKITQAMENMNAAGDLNYYQTPEEFVEGLKKHLKIIKVCDSEHLDECWPSKTITTSEKERYEVKNAKNGISLHTGNTTNNVGLILGDGTPIILSYDPSVGASAGDNITPFKKTLPVGFGKKKVFAYTSSITSGIDFVMDVNGTAGPNAETNDGGYHDIRSFKAAAFSNSTCPGLKIGNKCVVDLGTSYAPINCIGEEYNKNSAYCPSVQSKAVDYWAGAKKACDKMGMTLLNSRVTGIGLCNTDRDSMPKSGLYWTTENWTTLTQVLDMSDCIYAERNKRTYAEKYGALCIR